MPTIQPIKFTSARAARSSKTIDPMIKQALAKGYDKLPAMTSSDRKALDAAFVSPPYPTTHSMTVSGKKYSAIVVGGNVLLGEWKKGAGETHLYWGKKLGSAQMKEWVNSKGGYAKLAKMTPKDGKALDAASEGGNLKTFDFELDGVKHSAAVLDFNLMVVGRWVKQNGETHLYWEKKTT